MFLLHLRPICCLWKAMGVSLYNSRWVIVGWHKKGCQLIVIERRMENEIWALIWALESVCFEERSMWIHYTMLPCCSSFRQENSNETHFNQSINHWCMFFAHFFSYANRVNSIISIHFIHAFVRRCCLCASCTLFENSITIRWIASRE